MNTGAVHLLPSETIDNSNVIRRFQLRNCQPYQAMRKHPTNLVYVRMRIHCDYQMRRCDDFATPAYEPSLSIDRQKMWPIDPRAMSATHPLNAKLDPRSTQVEFHIQGAAVLPQYAAP
jgi:hypothetical protein